MRYFITLVVLLFSAFAGLATASAEKRVALVIGSAKYEHIARLPKVANDAKAMAALFEAAKFDSVVTLHAGPCVGERKSSPPRLRWVAHKARS